MYVKEKESEDMKEGRRTDNHWFASGKQVDFLKLMLANGISRFGDSIDMVAFSWITYQITNSATWSAIIVGVNQLISVVFQPIIGSVVENMNKKKAMVYADFCRFLTIFLFVVIYRLGGASSTVLVCFTAMISFIETFRIPAGVSVIPLLLDETDYDKGVSMNNSISKSCELVGLISVATLIAYLGVDGVIFMDGLTFLISSILISTIKYKHCKPIHDIKNNYISMTKDGIKFLWTKKSLFIICVLCGLINASVIPFDSLQSAYVNLYFEAKVQILSAVSIVISVGMLFGATVYRFIPVKYLNLSILSIGGIVIGIFYLVAFTIAKIMILGYTIRVRITLLLVASFIVGVALAFMNNYVQIYFIKEVKQEYLARIASIATTITTALSPMTAFIISVLTTILDTSSVFLVCGVAIIVSFVFLCGKMKKVIELEVL